MFQTAIITITEYNNPTVLISRYEEVNAKVKRFIAQIILTVLSIIIINLFLVVPAGSQLAHCIT